jgi:uncharacterized membrane protein
MADTSTQSIQVHAPVDRVAAVICDFPRYPEWVDAIEQIEVLEEYEDGYAARVRFVIDAGVLADDYTLEYAYADDITRIEWHLVEPSKTQKSQQGSYDLADNGDGTTTVTYMLEVELSIGMLGMFRRKAEKMIMDTALKQLKRRVESLPASRAGGCDAGFGGRHGVRFDARFGARGGRAAGCRNDRDGRGRRRGRRFLRYA